MRRVVVKISGHLIRDSYALRKLIETLYDVFRRGIEVILIPGGSIFADSVRDAQKSYGFNDYVAHWMAIKAMEIYGIYISKMYSSMVLEANSIDDIFSIWKNGFLPIVLPYNIVKEYGKDLPASWTVTSDSISILIAYLLGVDIAILTKIVDGIENSMGNIIRVIDTFMLRSIKQDVVDSYIPTAIERYRIPTAIVNAYKPHIITCIISNEKCDEHLYTMIIPKLK